MVESRDAYRARSLRRNERGRLTIRELKDVPCSDCGVKYPPYVMDFDHRIPDEKSFNLCEIWRSVESLRAEAEKCDVVCSNCHRERTWGPTASHAARGRPRLYD